MYQVMVKTGFLIGCYSGTPYEAITKMAKEKGFETWEEYAEYTNSRYEVDNFRIWILTQAEKGENMNAYQNALKRAREQGFLAYYERHGVGCLVCPKCGKSWPRIYVNSPTELKEKTNFTVAQAQRFRDGDGCPSCVC